MLSIWTNLKFRRLVKSCRRFIWIHDLVMFPPSMITFIVTALLFPWLSCYLRILNCLVISGLWSHRKNNTPWTDTYVWKEKKTSVLRFLWTLIPVQYLTHYHTKPTCNDPWEKVLWRHRWKRRKWWKPAFYLFSSNVFNPIKRRLHH